jgi:hypothetical protein
MSRKRSSAPIAQPCLYQASCELTQTSVAVRAWARVIFDATTDGTNRLRYVATEDIQPLVMARRETSEEEYIAFVRA